MNVAQPLLPNGPGSNVVDQEPASRVLLLGNDDRVLLAVARGLGRAKLDVHLAWCSPASAALKSRYVSTYHPLPPYCSQSFEWLDALNRLVQRQRFDLVIPCNDYAVIPLQTVRERLNPTTIWYLLNDEAFRIAFDKAETSMLAESLGINTPQEFLISADEVRELARRTEIAEIEGQELRFPVYLKPRSSVTHTDVRNKRSARRIKTAIELADELRGECPSEGILVQEEFSGTGIGVEVLASDGEVLMQFQHRRLRETIDGGSTYRESIAEIPELTEATGKMIRSLNYTGVGMFEYRYCATTKKWVFLEINARFWGSLPLAIASGANFPLGLYQLLVKDQRECASNFVVGNRCRNLVTDIRAFRKQKSSNLDLRNLLLGKDQLDFYSRDDWRPQIANLCEFAGSLFRKAQGSLGNYLRPLGMRTSGITKLIGRRF